VQVAGLVVVERVGAAGRGRVVAGRLVGKGGKGKAVGVEQRGRESPGLVAATRRRVLVLEVVVVADMLSAGRGGQQAGGAEGRRNIPRGVCDVEGICERVAGRAGERVRALVEVRKRRLERLDEVLIRLLRIGPAGGQSGSRASWGQVHGRPTTRAHHSTLASQARAHRREQTYRLRNMATALEGREGQTAGAHRELGEVGTLGSGLSRGCYETEQASQRVKPAFKPQGFSTRPERPRAYSDMGRKRRVASETSSGVDGLGRAQTQQFCDGLRRRRCGGCSTGHAPAPIQAALIGCTATRPRTASDWPDSARCMRSDWHAPVAIPRPRAQIPPGACCGRPRPCGRCFSNPPAATRARRGWPRRRAAVHCQRPRPQRGAYRMRYDMTCTGHAMPCQAMLAAMGPPASLSARALVARCSFHAALCSAAAPASDRAAAIPTAAPVLCSWAWMAPAPGAFPLRMSSRWATRVGPR
jgi:hypothetical protein